MDSDLEAQLRSLPDPHIEVNTVLDRAALQEALDALSRTEGDGC